MFNKKKTLGVNNPKPRSKKEIDQEYSHHAVLAGHKARIIQQMYQDIEKMQKERDEHIKKLMELNEEGMKLPREPEVNPIPESTL